METLKFCVECNKVFPVSVGHGLLHAVNRLVSTLEIIHSSVHPSHTKILILHIITLLITGVGREFVVHWKGSLNE